MATSQKFIIHSPEYSDSFQTYNEANLKLIKSAEKWNEILQEEERSSAIQSNLSTVTLGQDTNQFEKKKLKIEVHHSKIESPQTPAA